MSELDSFFAKRDRKKASGRQTGKVAKPPGVNCIQPEGKPVDTDGTTRELPRRNKAEAPKLQDEEDDDWKSVDSEEKKDYTGLKIQPLILPDIDENDSDGAADDSKIKSSGPWKITDISHPEEALSAQPVKTFESAPSLDEKPAVYVNPRERMMKPEGATPMTSSRGPPDVKSTLSFPSLYEVGKPGGLRSNQRVWNRNPAVSDAETHQQPVEMCHREESNNEKSRSFVARRQNFESVKAGQNSWRTPQTRGNDGRTNREKSNTKENWRMNHERSSNEIQSDSWRIKTKDKVVSQSEKFKARKIELFTAEPSDVGDVLGSNIGSTAEPPKVAKYVPPSMRHKLAT